MLVIRNERRTDDDACVIPSVVFPYAADRSVESHSAVPSEDGLPRVPPVSPGKLLGVPRPWEAQLRNETDCYRDGNRDRNQLPRGGSHGILSNASIASS